MVAETPGRGSLRFPEIAINFRVGNRSSQVFLPPTAQIFAIIGAVSVIAALCYFGSSLIRYGRIAAGREAAMVRAETANNNLQEEAAKLRDKLALAERDRRQAEAQLSAATSQAAPLPTPTATATQQIDPSGQPDPPLEQLRRRLHQLEAQRATLAARLSKVETERAAEQAHIGQYKTSLDSAEKKLRQISADRDRALGERDRLRARVAELEQRLSQRGMLPMPQEVAGGFRLAGLITTELAPAQADPASALLISDAPPQPESRGVAELGRRAVSEFRRLLASTGLNVERLFPQLREDRAEGGPFVVPPKTEQLNGISPDKLEAMRSLMKSLPLATPLDSYQLESRFGSRRDPFNHRVSFHTGIDLSAPYMSPVHATAAGTVIYAGYRSDYGKVVEIDHGNGISTLYAHLHRYVVSVGQKVAQHDPIGYLGSTGRSSGPHVHYEVLVNDEPQDPEKFIGLGRVIPAADNNHGTAAPANP